MAQRRKQRYRSNVFRPKVKQPLSFELTRHGRRRLKQAMVRGEVSLGDLIEFFVTKYGDRVSPDKILRVAEAAAAANKRPLLEVAEGILA